MHRQRWHRAVGVVRDLVHLPGGRRPAWMHRNGAVHDYACVYSFSGASHYT